MAKYLLLLFFSFCPLIFADQQAPHIVCGRDAKLGELPYQVSIQWPRNPQTYIHLCGGSILTPTWILSAAHCYMSFIKNYRVVAGIVIVNATNPERQAIDVVKHIEHPNFHGVLNDITLLQLAKPLKFNKFIQPVQLPKSGAEFNGKALASGWGATDNNAITRPNNLQAVELQILTASECARYFTGYSEKEHVCTGPISKGTCDGDSGGPLVQNGQIIGVVSFGGRTCACNMPTYFARVSNYVDFIKEHIEK